MSSVDNRFDDAEADIDRGTAWRFREEDAPNPLTIQVTEWSTGVTKLGQAEFMNGVDRDGKRWSVLVGSVVLTRRLIEGLVEQWSTGENAFVVVETLGRVVPGEIVSLKYLGDREGAQYDYPDFKVSRKPPTQSASAKPEQTPAQDDERPPLIDDDVPFFLDDDAPL